jgi:hypothetical protein
MVAAMGVAFGAIGSAMAYFLGLFKGIAPWQLPVIIIGLMLLISVPSLILAFMKLRKRNLGPILDANGWAVNAKAKVNVPFGTSLTGIAKLPPGSTVDISDRYAEKSAAWPKMLLILFIIWWIYAFASDMGILWRLTKNWETPLGNPPAGMTAHTAPKSDTAAAEAKAAADKAAAEAAAKTAAPPK